MIAILKSCKISERESKYLLTLREGEGGENLLVDDTEVHSGDALLNQVGSDVVRVKESSDLPFGN